MLVVSELTRLVAQDSWPWLSKLGRSPKEAGQFMREKLGHRDNEDL